MHRKNFIVCICLCECVCWVCVCVCERERVFMMHISCLGTTEVKHKLVILALKEEVLDNLPWKDERGPSSIDEHWNRFKGNVGETSERRGGAPKGFSERIDTILNWTKLVIFFVSRELDSYILTQIVILIWLANAVSVVAITQCSFFMHIPWATLRVAYKWGFIMYNSLKSCR